MDLGIRVGKSKVSKKGQSSLSIIIPKQVVENLNINKGDIVEYYQNEKFGENVLILVVRKDVSSSK